MSFSSIQYQTTNGENCVATKKDGIVTVQGDKNGVRQMPLPEFMQEFVKDQSKVSLERTPQKDSVSFQGLSNQQEEIQQNFSIDDVKSIEKKYSCKKKFFSSTYKLSGDGVDLKVKDGFLGARTVTGSAFGKDINLKLITDFGMLSSDKVKISGTIGQNDVNLAMKPKLGFWGGFKEGSLSGVMNSGDKNLLPIIGALSENRYMVDYNSAVAASACC